MQFAKWRKSDFFRDFPGGNVFFIAQWPFFRVNRSYVGVFFCIEVLPEIFDFVRNSSVY